MESDTQKKEDELRKKFNEHWRDNWTYAIDKSEQDKVFDFFWQEIQALQYDLTKKENALTVCMNSAKFRADKISQLEAIVVAADNLINMVHIPPATELSEALSHYQELKSKTL